MRKKDSRDFLDLGRKLVFPRNHPTVVHKTRETGRRPLRGCRKNVKTQLGKKKRGFGENN